MTENVDKGKHYRLTYRGIKFDPARAGRIYGITDPMLFQAFKKIAFAGKRGHKDRIADIEDAICALNRFLEMEKEDQETEDNFNPELLKRLKTSEDPLNKIIGDFQEKRSLILDKLSKGELKVEELTLEQMYHVTQKDLDSLNLKLKETENINKSNPSEFESNKNSIGLFTSNGII